MLMFWISHTWPSMHNSVWVATGDPVPSPHWDQCHATSTAGCGKQQPKEHFETVCVCVAADSVTGVGVSNSCLYNHSSSGSGRQGKNWHLYCCSVMAPIVTLCQKVTYEKNHTISGFVTDMGKAIFYFFLGHWESSCCQKMTWGSSGKFKRKKGVR